MILQENIKNISILINVGRELKENAFEPAAFAVGGNVPICRQQLLQVRGRTVATEAFGHWEPADRSVCQGKLVRLLVLSFIYTVHETIYGTLGAYPITLNTFYVCWQTNGKDNKAQDLGLKYFSQQKKDTATKTLP